MSIEVFGDEGDVSRDPVCEWCGQEIWADDEDPPWCHNMDCPGDPADQEEPGG